ncbi:MAG: class I SAM-dependent methyltransferase, partial [Chloroflexota bacterium]
MTKKTNYKALYERVGRQIGWDFTRLKVKTEGVKPDLYAEVVNRCNSDTILLDIGTGGGERIAKIAGNARLIVGIDISTSMINTAKRRYPPDQYGSLRFHQMNATHLNFPERFFDIVSCRQAPFDAEQV